MLAAGLLARKAVERGLSVSPKVKASLAPGSRVVTEYLARTGLQPYLDAARLQPRRLRLHDLHRQLRAARSAHRGGVTGNDIVAASVLSGNRNFEARIQQNIKANFLMSPPLVVAFALAGRVDIDMTKDPLGQRPRRARRLPARHLAEPSREIRDALLAATDPETYRRLYSDFAAGNPLWNEIPATAGEVYDWDRDVDVHPGAAVLRGFSMRAGQDPRHPGRAAARASSATRSRPTTSARPARSSRPRPPGQYLIRSSGVAPQDFNSYGSRRGNDRVMTRGTFANVRIKNLMVPGDRRRRDGPLCPTARRCDLRRGDEVPGARASRSSSSPARSMDSGSSRDWAAKGTRASRGQRGHRPELRAHPPLQPRRHGRSPLPVPRGAEREDPRPGRQRDLRPDRARVGLCAPRQEVTLTIHRADGRQEPFPVIVRIDTPIEVDYYRHGGILAYVLRQLVA